MPLLGPNAGRHAGVPLLGAIVAVPWLDAIAGCHGWMLATNFGGVHVGCHCWVTLFGAIAGVPLLGAMAECHCWMLATNFGGVHVGCHCSVPLLGRHCWLPVREKIDQSVTPFSAAPFSTLTTRKLVCAIWGLC